LDGKTGQREGTRLGNTPESPYLGTMNTDISRRNIIKLGATLTLLGYGRAALAGPVDERLAPRLLRDATMAFARHRGRLAHLDRIGIVDFSRPSSAARFFVVDVVTGTSQAHLVAHGRGSDPAHTGWARRFSNEPGSFASSTGAFVTGAEYAGHHGRSMRLVGLDPENCNAESRAIVVHGAWYVTPEIAARTGILGRSEGCFAVSNASLNQVIDRLGPGRLLYAARS
jgi:hypothetical protein